MVIDMAHPTYRQAVAAEVRAAKARRQISNAELADQSGISRASLSKKLNAHISFTVEELDAVARVLDVDTAVLIADTPRPDVLDGAA